ncbi:MAG: SprT family zinc-dependent metalloprotease [Candidatus Omnitrophica bacterium]|nr:SprT family zinc-dependent metalloprotease [Candidatus Omnitrophota bacterium]
MIKRFKSSENLDYLLIRQRRRKTLTITINADNSIVVKASKTLPQQRIDKFIKDKLQWIKKAIFFNSNEKTPYKPKDFIEGEKFLYLGKEYPFLIDQKAKNNVIFEDNALRLRVSKACKFPKKYIEKRLIDWYKLNSHRIFLERISFYEKMLNITISDLRVKTLKRTWGNCSKKGEISISWKLLMAPLEIIDYIIVHELCHLIHHNHSSSFWREVEKVMPEYKKHKRWLRVNENILKF